MIYGRGLHLSDTFTYRSAHNNLFVLLRVIHKLKMAFDIADHTILLSKVSAYGIQENACNWFKSYLENRTHICSVSGYPSRDYIGSSIVFAMHKRLTKGAIHSTKIPTGPTGKSGPPQKVDPFFRNFSGWTEPIH